MILVDASVIIEYLRNPSPDLLAALQSGDAVICGATRAEILAGSRHAQNNVAGGTLIHSNPRSIRSKCGAMKSRTLGLN